MNLLESIIYGLIVGVVISDVIFPGSLGTFIVSVILLILVLLYSKKSDKKMKSKTKK